MKEALFLYNPQSGRGRIERQLDAILACFARHGYRIEAERIDFTRNPFAGREQLDLAVVAGGDGTVNYVVNRMMERGLNLPLGIIPAGTANDFAGAIGMAKDPLTAAEQIATGTIARLDCGVANDRYFVNIFSFGLFTTTSQRTPDERKHRIGKLAYILEGIKELRRMHAVRLQVRTAEEHFAMDALIVLIFNGETAGGFRLARRSSVEDGLFDCLLMEKRNLLYSSWTMLRYLLGGSPRAVRHLRTAELELHAEVPEPTDADGQQGASFPLTIRCLKGALQIQCPAKPTNPNSDKKQ